MRPVTFTAAFAALMHLSSSILVTDGSSCSVRCGNVLDATTTSDITCDQGSYAVSAAGSVFESCIRCEVGSNYTADGQTDLQWMLCWSHTSSISSVAQRLTKASQTTSALQRPTACLASTMILLSATPPVSRGKCGRIHSHIVSRHAAPRRFL